MNAQARAILQEALARTAPLGESHPSHIAMLSALGESWRQDGNLLSAVGYLERAAAAQGAAPPPPTAQAVTSIRSGVFISGAMNGSYSAAPVNAYMRLADLYQQLGRPDAVAAIAVKIRALAANDEWALARFYEQRGQLAEAAAIYRRLAEQSADPQAKANAWQALAALAAGQQHFTDAVAVMQEAIAAVQPLENPGVIGQYSWMRQNLAGYLRSAGMLDQADQVYQQLLQQNSGQPQEAQMLGAYAQYLAETKRGAQGESLLKEYLSNHPSLDSNQRINFLFNLANVARRTGDSKSADEYQQAAQAMQPPQPPPVGQIRIAEKLQEAQTAANERRLPDAYRLVMDVLDTAAQAVDGQQVEWSVPQIASVLAANHETAKAEHLFQRLFTVAEFRKAGNMQPLIAVTQRHVDFLRNQPERLGEVPAAIEQYRRVLTDANGPDSASLVEPLRMTIDFERVQSQWPQANESARQLLELQESLSGNTSEPYLGDLQTAARVYQTAGDYARALPLFRKAITIADLLATPNNDWHRSQTRMDAAMVLALSGQFDEAETLGEEAVALHATQRTAYPDLGGLLQQIRQMKLAAASASAHRVQE